MCIRDSHPLLAPGRLHLDEVLAAAQYLEAEPTVVRPALDQPLQFLLRHGAHGVTTTLPTTSRSRIRRRPSTARSSGSTRSTAGLISPRDTRSRSARRSSSV